MITSPILSSITVSSLLLTTVAACARPPSAPIRVATFNASLNRNTAGQLRTDLAGTDSQAQAVAEIVQRVRPGILLINEFDWDETGESARLFHDRYLAVSQQVSGESGAEAIEYPFWYTASVNTGVPSGHDLDNDGTVGASAVAYGGDALGFGFFPGQYGMVVYSRFPLVEEQIRTFQSFLWRDMPDALLPVDPVTGEPWYSDAELAVLPLSSKSHWDVPVDIAGHRVHLLISHPTPPVFDGPEDRNGRRNHDEIRFWSDYITPDSATYLYDDRGTGGGLADGASFIIMGDQNADPFDGDSHQRPISMLLEHHRVDRSVAPSSPGAPEQTRLQGGYNEQHTGDPRWDTSDFADGERGPGNLRLDYVLPSKDLDVMDAGVFWPLSDDPLFALVGVSDHRLVWVDVAMSNEQ